MLTSVVPPPMKRIRYASGPAAAGNGVGAVVSSGGTSLMPDTPALPQLLVPASPISPAFPDAAVAGLIPTPGFLPGQQAAELPVFVGESLGGGSGSPLAAPLPMPIPAPPGGWPVIGSGGSKASSPRAKQASPAERVQSVLRRFPRTFCQELKIDMAKDTPASLWQWLCASVLFSARIKSNAAVGACRGLLDAGLTTPAAFVKAGKGRVKALLASNGYDRSDGKTAEFLVENAQTVQSQYGGDLNALREAAGRIPGQERTLLKKLRGVGDGACDIFFRQAQVAWEELFPFGDKKALKAARLVGLKEHPQALAQLCGNDRTQYAHLLAALVMVDMNKAFADI